MVSVVTRAPRCAARVARPPQPVPISSTCMSGPTRGHVQDAVDLAALGVGERLVRVGEPGRRVAHRLVEERREQLVGQVVVAVDVLPRALDGVALLRAAGAPRRSAARCRCSSGGISVESRAANGVSRSASSVRGPVAHHVGLAEADLRVAAEPVEERRRPHDPHHRRVRAAAADALAAREHHPHGQRCAPRGGTGPPRCGRAARTCGGVARPGQTPSAGRGTKWLFDRRAMGYVVIGRPPAVRGAVGG